MNAALFLALVWPAGNSAPPAPSEAEWREIADIARQHRLRPLMDQRRRELGWAVPQDLSDEWRAAYVRAERRALHQKVQLARIARWLDEAGIDVTVLKGGALAWRGWFEPALRPMRDLDLLVAQDRAIEVQRLLIAKGFVGTAPEEMGDEKHLPGLSDPQTGVLVEVHTALIETATPEWRARNGLFLSEALPARTRPKGLPMATFTEGDILLHVIAHSVLDHQFNNGPLFLLDLEVLLARGEIDWGRFWALAAKTGLTRAAQLALALAETLLPQVSVTWLEASAPELDRATIDNAASLMFVPAEQRTELGLLGRTLRFRWREQPRMLLRALRRAGSRAEQAPVSASGDAGLRQRLAIFGDRAARNHVRRSLDVARWLRG